MMSGARVAGLGLGLGLDLGLGSTLFGPCHFSMFYCFDLDILRPLGVRATSIISIVHFVETKIK